MTIPPSRSQIFNPIDHPGDLPQKGNLIASSKILQDPQVKNRMETYLRETGGGITTDQMMAYIAHGEKLVLMIHSITHESSLAALRNHSNARDITWFLMACAAQQGSEFISGAFQIYDSKHHLYHYFKDFDESYTRPSTHISSLRTSETDGEKSTKLPQKGLDFDDAYVLPGQKHTILFGLVHTALTDKGGSHIHRNKRKDVLYLKLEEAGFGSASEKIKHTITTAQYFTKKALNIKEQSAFPSRREDRPEIINKLLSRSLKSIKNRNTRKTTEKVLNQGDLHHIMIFIDNRRKEFKMTSSEKSEYEHVKHELEGLKENDRAKKIARQGREVLINLDNVIEHISPRRAV